MVERLGGLTHNLRPTVLTLAVALMVLAAACDNGTADHGGGGGGGVSPPTERPTTRPTFDLSAAVAALRNRAELVADGKVAPQPFVLDWNAIAGNTTLSKPKADAFCSALDLPKADDALASLAALALNALSEKVRHRPLVNEEAEGFLKLAATFATKTCPAWEPQIVSLLDSRPAPTPPPGTFLALPADPDVTWSRPMAPLPCAHKRCWQIDVSSRLGCASVHAVLALRDSDQVVVRRIVFDSDGAIGLLTPSPVQFWTEYVLGVNDAIVETISCT